MADTEKGGYKCPKCGKFCNARIVNSRRTLYGKKRRRICELCGERFTTVEIAIPEDKMSLCKLIQKWVG